MSFSFCSWGAAAPVTTPLHDGGSLDFAGRTVRVHHRPDHLPSDTVFHDAEGGLPLGADHLIKHISSNPLIAPPMGGDADSERAQALVTYLASLSATRARDLDVVLPGHGGASDLTTGR